MESKVHRISTSAVQRFTLEISQMDNPVHFLQIISKIYFSSTKLTPIINQPPFNLKGAEPETTA